MTVYTWRGVRGDGSSCSTCPVVSPCGWCDVLWQRYGDTALLRSCENGHVDIVRVLLGRPDVDVRVANVSGAGSW